MWYAWPSFDSFLLVLVATIMRALTIIAIESAYADSPYSVDEVRSRSKALLLAWFFNDGMKMLMVLYEKGGKSRSK